MGVTDWILVGDAVALPVTDCVIVTVDERDLDCCAVPGETVELLENDFVRVPRLPLSEEVSMRVGVRVYENEIVRLRVTAAVPLSADLLKDTDGVGVNSFVCENDDVSDVDFLVVGDADGVMPLLLSVGSGVSVTEVDTDGVGLFRVEESVALTDFV